MTIEEWLADACADADRRGIPDLKPLLASLADATSALRGAGWDGVDREERGSLAARQPVPEREHPADGGADRRPPGEGAAQ